MRIGVCGAIEKAILPKSFWRTGGGMDFPVMRSRRRRTQDAS